MASPACGRRERGCYASVVVRTTGALACVAAVLAAAVGCSTSSGAGGADAAAPEAAAVSDGAPVEAGDDESGAPSCATAGGQCEQGAVCEEFLPANCGAGGARCCLHVLCAADAQVQLIQASDYDQSCTVDSDCVEVYVGNACSCELGCRTTIGPINKAAQPQYTTDVANAPHVVCSCPPTPPPLEDAAPVACCVGGQCQTVTGQCSGPADAGAGAAPADGGAE